MKELSSKLKRSKPKIAIIGDLMLDTYFFGEANRISPEAPVQVVNIQKEKTILGGAGNVANNLISLGSEVYLFSVIGNDQNGEKLKNLCEKSGINSEMIILDDSRITTEKTRILASSQQIVRTDREIKSDIPTSSENRLIELFMQKIELFDIVIISDYAKGVLTQKVTSEIINITNQKNIKTIVDPKGDNFFKYNGAFLVKPNRKEALTVANSLNINQNQKIEEVGNELLKELKIEHLLITLSEEGMALFSNEENSILFKHIPTVAKEVFDVTGAGDTAIASLSFSLASGINLIDSMKFANLASGVVIAKVGTSVVTIDEILEYESSISNSYGINHIKTKEEIINIVSKARENSKKIVFTNGCFDILHVGHVRYLEEAKHLGDILIVGLNSDSSVKRLKGENRPVNTENDRAYILGSLEAVDYVVIFEEDTPLSLIKSIQPDILVKGADYKNKEVVGSEIAKEVKLIDFVDGQSTTNIISKILNSKESKKENPLC